MGNCFGSTTADSSAPPTTPAPKNKVHSRKASRDAPRAPAVSSKAPLPSSNGNGGPAHQTDPRNAKTTSPPPSQPSAPFAVNPSLPPQNCGTARAPPPLAVLVSSSFRNEGMHVSPPPQPVGGTTVSPRAEPITETSNRERRAPSSYRPQGVPVKKSISAQPLPQSGSPASSLHPVARAMSEFGPPPDANPENMARKQSRSTREINKVVNDNGHQRFTSTVRTLLSDTRFRILVVGKTHSGKSSLVNSIFKVDMSTALGNMSRKLKTADINAGCAPRENRHLIVHEYSSFESGVGQNTSTIREFVIGRTHANRPASERLHAIWICVPASDIIDGNLGDGMDEILGMNKVVPVVVVATKFDLVVSRVLFEIASGDTRFYEEAKTTAYERYKQSCRSLFPRSTRDVAVETVSTKSGFGDLIAKLITTTHKLIMADPRNAIIPSASSETRVANPQIAPVPLVWSIAQRISHDLIIQASIEVGCSRYWRGLRSSQDFTDQMFEDCIDVIHTDIIEVWSLRDEDGYLSGRKFKTKMYGHIKDLAEPQIGSPLSSNPHDTSKGQASMNKAPWGSYSYQNSIENIRYMMGHIVDLTVILHWLFVSAHDVSASKVHEAMNYHANSGRRDQVHQDIGRFVTEETLFTYRGRDVVMEKIIDLIRQSCVTQQNT